MLNHFLLIKLKENFPNKTDTELQSMIDGYNKKFEDYHKHYLWKSTLGEQRTKTVRLGKNQKIIENLKHLYYTGKQQ